MCSYLPIKVTQKPPKRERWQPARDKTVNHITAISSRSWMVVVSKLSVLNQSSRTSSWVEVTKYGVTISSPTKSRKFYKYIFSLTWALLMLTKKFHSAINVAAAELVGLASATLSSQNMQRLGFFQERGRCAYCSQQSQTYMVLSKAGDPSTDCLFLWHKSNTIKN